MSTKRLITVIAAVAAVVAFSTATFAVAPITDADTIIVEQTQVEIPVSDNATKSGPRPLRFVWGAEISGAVELSGHEMSTLGIGASFGMQWQWIRFLGISAEADIMVSNSSRIFPLTLNFRTDFSKSRRLLFLDLRGGTALTYFNDEGQKAQPYGSVGLGVTLAAGRKFASHLIVSYAYVGRDHCFVGERERKCPGMSYATMRLGITF